jgi:hypothetical protein
VTASTREALNAAVKKINELMEQSFTPSPTSTTPRPPGSHPGGVCIITYFINISFLFKLNIPKFIIETICTR